MGSNSVLVIDDDEDIRETLGQALEFEGYKVLKAIHGQDALDLLEALNQKDYPKLIILDLMMPVMDGSEFLGFIHTHKKDTLALIPIVLATAKGSLGSIKNAELARESIKKPLDLEFLYEVVKKYCG